jgi:small subunit ribosomal protein S2
VNKELARDLIAAGVHFGHGVSRWNPKMKPYIFGKRSKIHIIDIKQTIRGMLIANKLITDVVSSGKDVVFVGTKRQAQNAVVKASEICEMHCVSERWLGGMLTNFQTVRSRLKRLEELEAMEKSGKLAAESKKQESRLKREMRKIQTNLGGVRKMSKLPGLVVVVDAKKEHLALREAKKLGIATIAVIDTDSDPDECDVAIPANDDSIKALDIILTTLGTTAATAKSLVRAAGDAGVAPRGGKSKRQALASADGGVKPAPRAIAEKPAPAPAVKPAEAPVAPVEKPAEAPAAPVAPAEVPAEAPAEKTEEKPAE